MRILNDTLGQERFGVDAETAALRRGASVWLCVDGCRRLLAEKRAHNHGDAEGVSSRRCPGEQQGQGTGRSHSRGQGGATLRR